MHIILYCRARQFWFPDRRVSHGTIIVLNTAGAGSSLSPIKGNAIIVPSLKSSCYIFIYIYVAIRTKYY